MGIVIMGGTGTGKSTLARILSMHTTYKLYEIGYVVKNSYFEVMAKEAFNTYKNKELAIESIKKTYKENSKDYFTNKRLKYVNDMVNKNGNDYFIVKLLKEHLNEEIIVVGARTFDEINAINTYMKNPFFVGLICKEDKLTKRFVKREDRYMSSNNAEKIFEKRRWTEKKWGVEDVLDKCDIVIETDDKKPRDIADIVLKAYRKKIIKINRKIKLGELKNEQRRVIY